MTQQSVRKLNEAPMVLLGPIRLKSIISNKIGMCVAVVLERRRLQKYFTIFSIITQWEIPHIVSNSK